MLVRVYRFFIQTITSMNESVLYILIAVFALLTMILVWFGAKAILDIRKRKEAMKRRQQSFRADKQRNRYKQ